MVVKCKHLPDKCKAAVFDLRHHYPVNYVHLHKVHSTHSDLHVSVLIEVASATKVISQSIYKLCFFFQHLQSLFKNIYRPAYSNSDFCPESQTAGAQYLKLLFLCFKMLSGVREEEIRFVTGSQSKTVASGIS